MTGFPPGRVRDGIVDYLERVGDEGATLAELYRHFELTFSTPAPKSSIRSYLRLNSLSTFRQLGRGKYGLMQPHETLKSPGVGDQTAPPVRYSYGAAQLYCADAIEWLKTQPDESIHGVVTDPPYGLVEYSSTEQAKLRSGKGGTWRIPPSFDGHVRSPLPRFTTLSPDELDELHQFFRTFGQALLPVLVPGAHIVLAANPLLSHLVSYALDNAGFERRGEIVRLVTTLRGGDRPKNAHEEFPGVSVMPRSMWEPWLLFRKPLDGTAANTLRKYGTGGLRRVSDIQPFGDVIRSSPTHAKERQIANHPSLKPQAFLRQVVRAVLPMGTGTVLDPFAGSGSTLAAAEYLGYRSIGVERDTDYVELASSAIPKLAALTTPALSVEIDPGLSELQDSIAM